MKIRDRIKELKRVPAGDLLPNPKNWRTHPAAQADALRGVLGEVGFADAVLARETENGLMLIDGHLRAEVAPDASVPVLVLDVTQDEADKILATHDPLAAMATTDAGQLADLLEGMRFDSDAATAMTESLAKVEGIEQSAEVVEDEVPEPPADPITEPGDLWTLGDHRVLCGDATNAEDVARAVVPDVQLVMITDPPYCSGGYQESGKGSGSIGTRGVEMIANDTLSTRGYQALIRKAIDVSSCAVVHVFTDWRMWVNLFDVVESSGFGVRAMVVWNKATPGMGRGWRNQHELIMVGSRVAAPFNPTSAQGNVITCARTGNIHHATEKPVEVLTRIMDVADFCDHVYDPFLGSGTTLVAAEQLGRKCYGLEISPAYCDVIVNRWESLTGRKAERNGARTDSETNEAENIVRRKERGPDKPKRTRSTKRQAAGT